MKCRVILGFLLAPCLVSLLTGCGSGNVNQQPNSNLIPVAALRSLQVGDKWIYSATGQVNLVGLSQTSNFTGLVTRSITSSAVNNTAAEADYMLLSQTSGNAVFSNTIYFTQDAATNNIIELGDSGGSLATGRVLTTPTLSIPGSWRASVAFSNQLDFSNGDTQMEKFAVVGAEKVSTTAGTFVTWKVNRSVVAVSGSDHTGFVETDWYAPQLGAAVKFNTIFTDAAGNSISVNASLQSTTVPH